VNFPGLPVRSRLHAELFRNHPNARAARDGQSGTDRVCELGLEPRTAAVLALRLGSRNARLHALLDHLPLELSKGADHVEHELTGGGGCIEALLVQNRSILSDRSSIINAIRRVNLLKK
jgi:hypothetical protein